MITSDKERGIYQNKQDLVTLTNLLGALADMGDLTKAEQQTAK